jgi:hypothetical protein
MSISEHDGRIFVSYANSDRHLVNDILLFLRERKIISTFDEIVMSDTIDLASEQGSLRELIREEIAKSDTVVIIWSEAASNSQWVNYEMALADGLEKNIVYINTSKEKPTLPIDIANNLLIDAPAGKQSLSKHL